MTSSLQFSRQGNERLSSSGLLAEVVERALRGPWETKCVVHNGFTLRHTLLNPATGDVVRLSTRGSHSVVVSNREGTMSPSDFVSQLYPRKKPVYLTTDSACSYATM